MNIRILSKKKIYSNLSVIANKSNFSHVFKMQPERKYMSYKDDFVHLNGFMFQFDMIDVMLHLLWYCKWHRFISIEIHPSYTYPYFT